MTEETFTPNKPTAIDIEVTWDKNQTIVSKSDLFGTIDYANEAFANVSGYEEYSIMKTYNFRNLNLSLQENQSSIFRCISIH